MAAKSWSASPFIGARPMPSFITFIASSVRPEKGLAMVATNGGGADDRGALAPSMPLC